MDKKLTNFLEQREHTVLTDIDVITAAVAVPLLEIDGEDHVVFTVRSNTLRRQPGEISFPGGHCEPNDKSGAYAAMRECSEELGIGLDKIELLGNLDCTSQFKPNIDEVSEVFTVPLRYLLDMEPTVGHLDIATRPLRDFPFHLLEGYNIDWKIRQTTLSISIPINNTPYGD